MELTAEQDATFREYCKEIKQGEFGRVVVNFIGSPNNEVHITGEKNCRFGNQKLRTKAEPTRGKALEKK